MDLNNHGERPDSNLRWVLIIIIAVLALLSSYHAIKCNAWAVDDLIWREKGMSGLQEIWTTPSPFGHFRPVFGTWLAALGFLGIYSPFGLSVAGFILVLGSGILFFKLACSWLLLRESLLAAAIIVIHPVRQSHLFWMSAQIDALALVLFLGTLLFVGFFRQGRLSVVTGAIIIFALSALCILTKETAGLLPLIILLFPGGSGRRRLLSSVFSLAGIMAGLFYISQILPSLGKQNSFFYGIDPLRILKYPVDLFWPLNVKLIWMDARFSGNYFWVIFLGVLFALISIFLFRLIIKRISLPATRAALTLLGSAAIIYVMDTSHRGIGLGAAGIALLISLIPGTWLKNLKQPRRIIILLIIPLLWVPVWMRAEISWTEAKKYSQSLMEFLTELKTSSNRDQVVVELGGMNKINELAWPADITQYDRRYREVLSRNVRTIKEPAVISGMGNEIYRISAGHSARFCGFCIPDPWLGTVKVTCRKGFFISAVFDKKVFLENNDPHRYRFIYWDGKQFNLLK